MLSQAGKAVKINWFVKYDVRLDLSIWYRGPKITGTFKKRAPGTRLLHGKKWQMIESKRRTEREKRRAWPRACQTVCRWNTCNCFQCGFLLCIFRFLTYDPKKRITADKALEHEYFSVSAFCWFLCIATSWLARLKILFSFGQHSF